MCNFNMLCQIRDGSCLCSQYSTYSSIIRPFPVSSYPVQDPTAFSTLFKILHHQNEMIKNILDQTKAIFDKVLTLSSPSSNFSSSIEETTTIIDLQQLLCGNEKDHKYSLKLVNDLPTPAYKERAFSVMVQIVDKDSNKVTLTESCNFKVMLFTTENPPKVIKLNTSGDKILKGTVDSNGNSTILFRKIAVKEVTSHFRSGCFFFVITTKMNKDIRPLIVDRFVVKARKINNEPRPSKKSKLSAPDSPSADE